MGDVATVAAGEPASEGVGAGAGGGAEGSRVRGVACYNIPRVDDFRIRFEDG